MRVTVIGLGKLGSPLAAVLASKGFFVNCYDVNRNAVKQISDGIAPVKEPGLQELLDKYKSRISGYDNLKEALSDSDISFIIVPTPSMADGYFDNSYLINAVTELGKCLSSTNNYHVVNIVSTTMPGSVHGPILDALESSSGKKVGCELGLTYNPEFIALGSVIRDMLFPDMILIGQYDSKAGDVLASVYRTVVGDNVPINRLNLIEAEVTKITVNTFVTTKISFSSMLASICEKISGADASKICNAVGLDSRVGKKYFSPGAPFGGPCFPRDAIAFSSWAEKINAIHDISLATTKTNNQRLYEIGGKVLSLCNSGQKVGILGLSYKPGTHIIEESFGVKLANLLIENRCEVSLWDRSMLENDYPTVLKNFSKTFNNFISESDVIVIALNDFEAVNELLVSNLYLIKKDRVKFVDLWNILPADTPNVCWRIGNY